MNLDADPEKKNQGHLLEKSRSLLGWPLIQKALASYACSPVTINLCKSLTPHTDIHSANNDLDKTTEMVELLSGGHQGHYLTNGCLSEE